MITLCDVWLAQSPRFRLICWCGWMLGLLILVTLCLYPLARERTMQRESLVQQRAAIQMQWRDVYLLAASPAESEEKLTLFSPLLFQNSLTRLIHWQPSAQGRDGADIGLGCYPADVCPVGGSGDERQPIFAYRRRHGAAANAKAGAPE